MKLIVWKTDNEIQFFGVLNAMRICIMYIKYFRILTSPY